MRFKITFTNLRNRFLPANYNSYIHSWIYKRIGEADEAFAAFLHQKGYGAGHRRFKLFNFSPLDLRPYTFHKERGLFELHGSQISLMVSFYLPETAEPFIKGLFMNNEVFIGDRINGVDMTVREVQIMPEPEFSKKMSYRLVSPCCISRPARGDEKHAQYLAPGDPEYLPRLIENIKTKWKATGKVPAITGEPEDIDIDVNILTKSPRSRLLTIKPLTERQTKVRGWLFDCEVAAPMEVQEFIYAVGLGEKGSMGFGMVGAI
jgi:CRISPR-associated endoribonuclease Cas6